jgi:hypothetical protein
MGVFRIYPSADTWITDAHPERSTSVRATGSNHGRSPSLNVFARKGDITSGSIEKARTLMQFSLTELSGLVFDQGLIPSGSTYYFKLHNMQHADTVPTSYDIDVLPLSRSWDEGTGIDDDEHLDLGYASWKDATANGPWTVTGSDYLTTMSASQHFDQGTEDLEVDVTQIVNEWLTGSTIANNGVVVKLSDTDETNSINNYRKAFHGRETLYIDRMPYLEARWSNVVKDHRHNFAYDNNNTLVFYNFVRGELQTLTNVSVQVKDHIADPQYSQSFGAAEISTGIFTASVYIDSSGSYSGSLFYDIWTANGATKITGSFQPLLLTGSAEDVNDQLVLNVKNLKRVYRTNEQARLVVNARKKDFFTHRGTLSTSSLDPEIECLEKLYYSVINDETGEVVIPFGTGSLAYTQTSYNRTGNYFDLWMRTFVPGFKYRLLFLADVNNDVSVIDNEFTFKVV